ncbi:hypothetical protein [Streptomyces specialis]|uniref:hypothetical protein n=1 Tax=Streptomyces specialis TaxID=498367 RepID=UPI00073EE87B|nr:hypothetical protein [Streptomyces specialis]
MALRRGTAGGHWDKERGNEYGWTKHKIEERVGAVRSRLHHSGRVRTRLMRDEDDTACDATLMHNLLRELVDSTTLVPRDLTKLDHDLDD